MAIRGDNQIECGYHTEKQLIARMRLDKYYEIRYRLYRLRLFACDMRYQKPYTLTSSGIEVRFRMIAVGHLLTEFSGCSTPLCDRGFHFCERLFDCIKYYPLMFSSKIAEVEAIGKIIKSDNKCVTNKIKIVKELGFCEAIEIIRKQSDEINNSHAVNWSRAVNWSYAVNESDAVNWSDGVNKSHAVNNSLFVKNSSGVSNELFVANKQKKYKIFGVEVSEERFNEVKEKLDELFDYKYLDMERLKLTKKQEKYIRSLPEFNEEIFKEIFK